MCAINCHHQKKNDLLRDMCKKIILFQIKISLKFSDTLIELISLIAVLTFYTRNFADQAHSLFHYMGNIN